MIAPSGSNVTYIEGVLRGVGLTAGLAYHSIGVGNHTANLDHTPITARCIKIYFDKFYELIILNWHYKVRLFVDRNDKRYTHYGPEWEQQQKEAWKAYGDKWEIRAVLRWLYSVYNDPSYVEKIKTPGRNFNGCCLYEGYEESKREFANFGVNYTKEQYDRWRDSQKNIISVWKNMDKPNFVDEFEYDFAKGIYIGLQGIKNQMTEDQAWEHYIK